MTELSGVSVVIVGWFLLLVTAWAGILVEDYRRVAS